MAKTKYCYSVYDRIQEKFILEAVALSEVVNEVNIPKDKVVQYSQNGYVYNRQYIISRELLDGNDIDPEYRKIKMSPEFEEEWDKACLRINPNARELQ